MKRAIFSALLLLGGSYAVQAQLGDTYLTIYFDGNNLNHISYDTAHHHNSWQIAPADKPVLNSEYSAPGVMITEADSSYPIKDTSVFYIKTVVEGRAYEGLYNYAPFAVFSGYYNVYTDTLTDYGRIDFSADNGVTWIDIFNDTAYSNIIDQDRKPVLSGNSNGWQSFSTDLAALGPLLDIQLGDTLWYRFTFISDSIQTNKDGLMFDDIHFEDYIMGVEEIGFNRFHSVLYPNPSSGDTYIRFDNTGQHSFEIFVLDGAGNTVKRISSITSDRVRIDAAQLPPGVYYYKLISNGAKIYSAGSFVRP